MTTYTQIQLGTDSTTGVIYENANGQWTPLAAVNGVVNVLAFGAVADGYYDATIAGFNGTDNSSAFQDALDYAAANNKAVYVPGGNYRFARRAPFSAFASNLTQPNGATWHMVGDGLDKTVLMLDEDVTVSQPNNSLLKALGTTGSLIVEKICFQGLWSYAPVAYTQFDGSCSVSGQDVTLPATFADGSPRSTVNNYYKNWRIIIDETGYVITAYVGSTGIATVATIPPAGTQAFLLRSPSGQDVRGARFIFVQNGLDRLRLQNCAFYDCRWQSVYALKAKDVFICDNELKRNASDGFRLQHCSGSEVARNIVDAVDDNCFSFHSIDEQNGPNRSRVIVHGNIITNSVGFAALGAHTTIFSNNIMERCHGMGMVAGSSAHPEGDGSQALIIVSNNIIKDHLSRYDEGVWQTSLIQQAYITVGGAVWSPSPTTGYFPDTYVSSTFYPPYAVMDATAPWGAMNVVDWLVNQNDPTTYASVPTRGIFVVNNHVARTLPATTLYSDWGFGLYFSRYGYQDPEITDARFWPSGITLLDNIDGALISGNFISSMPSAGIYLQERNLAQAGTATVSGSVVTLPALFNNGNPPSTSTNYYVGWIITISAVTYTVTAYNGTTLEATVSGTPPAGSQTFTIKPPQYTDLEFRKVNISKNIIVDCGEQGLTTGLRASSTLNFSTWGVTVENNVFDIDPYFKNSVRTSPFDGTWQSSSNTAVRADAINLRGVQGCTIRGNTFRNCYSPVTANSTPATQHNIVNNVVECNPVALGYNAGNVGVGFIYPAGAAYRYTIFDMDPASATFRLMLNQCLSESSTVPTTGTYVTGQFVQNTSPTTASSKTLIGWCRQTVGSGHIVATTTTADWAPIYTTTS